MELYFLGLGIFLLICLWGILSPRSLYWTTTAWQYRNPDAVEPSDAAYTITRISSVIGAGIAIAVFVFLIGEANRQQAEEAAQASCEEILAEFKGVWGGNDKPRPELDEFAAAHDLTLEVTSDELHLVGTDVVTVGYFYVFADAEGKPVIRAATNVSPYCSEG